MDTSPLQLFRRLTNGVYVVGVRQGDRQSAFTAAWITQVSFDPLLIVLSINPNHASYPLLIAARGFAVSVLPADGIRLAEHFGTQSSRSTDKLTGQEWTVSPEGFPVLSAAVAQFDCSVTGQQPAGDHVLVTARVNGGTVVNSRARPLLYADTGNLDGSAAIYPDSFS